MKKCPFCQHKFERKQAIIESINGTNFYRCPNPTRNDSTSGDPYICRQRLPLKFFNSESATIPIIGSVNVGKTYYFLALLLSLKGNRSLHKIGISGDLVGSDSVKKDVLDLLDQARAGQKLNATKIDSAAKAAIEIIINKNNSSKVIYLSLFDTPGEAYKSEDSMIENLSNVFDADGIIFLVDPAQLNQFHSYVLDNYDTPDPDGFVNFSTMTKNIVGLLDHIQNNKTETQGNRSSDRGLIDRLFAVSNKTYSKVRNKMINKKIPITFTISKFDQIEQNFSIDLPFDGENMENYVLLNRKFNHEYFNEISTGLELVIGDRDEGDPNIIETLRSSGFPHSFLACNSGFVDPNDNKFKLGYAKGVALPLLWVLNKLNKY